MPVEKQSPHIRIKALARPATCLNQPNINVKYAKPYTYVFVSPGQRVAFSFFCRPLSLSHPYFHMWVYVQKSVSLSAPYDCYTIATLGTKSLFRVLNPCILTGQITGCSNIHFPTECPVHPPLESSSGLSIFNCIPLLRLFELSNLFFIKYMNSYEFYFILFHDIFSWKISLGQTGILDAVKQFLPESIRWIKKKTQRDRKLGEIKRNKKRLVSSLDIFQ